MSETFTPGPWEVYRQPINGAGDAVLELVEQVQATSPIGDTLFLINADGKCPALTGCGPTSEANACLIAAAPELYEALEAAAARCAQYADYIRDVAKADELECHPYLPQLDDEVAKALTALAKARGQ